MNRVLFTFRITLLFSGSLVKHSEKYMKVHPHKYFMIILRGTFVKRKINGLNSVNELPNSQFIYTFKQNLRLLGNLKKKKLAFS